MYLFMQCFHKMTNYTLTLKGLKSLKCIVLKLLWWFQDIKTRRIISIIDTDEKHWHTFNFTARPCMNPQQY